MILSRVRKRRFETWSFYTKLALKFTLFLIFLSMLFFLAAKFKTYFPIKSVKIYGIQHVDQETMQKSLVPLVHKGFFSIDVENIKEHLLQSPWVSKAVVQRVWPDKILITLVEKTPVARWNNAKLLSNNGEIFSPANNIPKGLPEFIGLEGEHIHVLEYYNKLNKLLSTLNFKITRLELTPDFSWNLTFDNGMKVSVDYKDILTRMSHFVKVYPKIIGKRVAEVDHVDLRYTNGFAVKWKTLT